MHDLLVMGSGVVGNFAAAYFRRYFPTLRVTVVGRSNQELPIVGESLVELSTQFLQDLGLSRTLIEQHLPKYGLTYYYKLDPSRPRDPGYIVDTNVYRNYMYRAKRRYSSQGWFLVGDAADTVDPLYSTGLALASVSIQQVGAMVRRDLEGKLSEAYVEDLDRAYAGVHGTSSQMVGTLYEAMEDGIQCHLRMNLSISTMFHLAIPLILNGYYTDPVGARLAARFGGPSGMIRQLGRFDPLIARAARKLSTPSPEHFIKVQSSLTLNFPYFEYHREEDIPRSISQMFRHMTAMRLRLLRLAGIRSWIDPIQLGALLQTLLSAVAVACFGRRSLKNSRLIQWVVAPRRNRRQRGTSATSPLRHTKPWLRKIAERRPASRRLRLP